MNKLTYCLLIAGDEKREIMPIVEKWHFTFITGILKIKKRESLPSYNIVPINDGVLCSNALYTFL